MPTKQAKMAFFTQKKIKLGLPVGILIKSKSQNDALNSSDSSRVCQKGTIGIVKISSKKIRCYSIYNENKKLLIQPFPQQKILKRKFQSSQRFLMIESLKVVLNFLMRNFYLCHKSVCCTVNFRY